MRAEYRVVIAFAGAMPGAAVTSVLCAAALLGDPSATEPKPKPAMVVRPLEVEGDVAPGWQQTFAAALERGLARQTVRLQIADEGAGGCGNEDAGCWRDFARSRDAAFLVRARVRKVESDYEITLELVEVGPGEVAARARQVCELCGLAEVGTLLEDVAGTLVSRVESLVDANAVVLFESAPPGARLFLDGQEVGPMPRSREVEPGTHRAEAVLSGHVSQRRSFEAQAGLDQTVRFELAPVPKPRRSVSPWGWASLGTGVAAIAAGSVLLAIDEDPITSRCDGDNVNSVGVCKFRRNTLGGGIALVSVGAAAVVTGAVLLITQRRRKTRASGAQVRGLQLRF